MLAIQTDAAAKELRDYAVELERKLTNMVAGFAYEVTSAASENTPIGNAEDLEAGLDFYRSSTPGRPTPQAQYAGFYLKRFKRHGLPLEVGYHRGAWVYSASGSPVAGRDVQDPGDAANAVEERARGEYKIGETFYIVGSGPGFSTFEAGKNMQAPDGILGPTLEDIQVTYSADLYRYFNQQ